VGSSHRTLREVVSDEIRQMIIAGDLAPGERLFEDRLAEQLGVSRNPVREALRALEGTGLVEVVPRRGAYVSRFEPDRARQLLDLRSVLESYAAELAARNRTDDDLLAMRDCIEQGRKATAENDVASGPTGQRVLPASADDEVVPSPAPYLVVAVAAPDGIVARAADHVVEASSADQDVPAGATTDEIDPPGASVDHQAYD